MKPPIFIFESGDLLSFKTPEAVSLGLEAVDVIHGRYKAYDSEGRSLSLRVERNKNLRKRGRNIVILEDTDGPSNVAELREILIQFLTGTGSAIEWLQKASLQQLVEVAQERGKTQ